MTCVYLFRGECVYGYAKSREEIDIEIDRDI
jgi:hypothetical protein